MSIEDVLKKLGEGVKLEPQDIEELKVAVTKKEGGENINDKALKEAKAAQARILEEKKKLQEKLAEQEVALEALKTGGMSEIEKATKEVEKATKAREKLENELNEMKAKIVQTERNYALEKISGKVKFLDTIPEQLRSYAITTAFKDVQDLTQEDAVEKVLTSFKESHKGILASDVDVRGSGSNGQSISASNKAPENMSVDERAKHLRGVVREKTRI